MSTEEGWTIEELRTKLRQFEDELLANGYAEKSIRTYVDRSEIFLRWLVGEYKPQRLR